MSTPINHHYVSRCQSNNFFDNARKRIFVLDKQSLLIREKQSTKTLFSEDDANTKTNDDLTVDRESLEKDLKDNFEDHYAGHLNVIRSLIQDPSNPPSSYRDSLVALTKFGIIGEIRNPINKKRNDDTLGDVLFGHILPNAAPGLKNQLLELKERLAKTKYSNSILYSESADDIFKRMGDVRCLIYSITCEKYFLLPDVSSIRLRAKINEYFNPDILEIAMVGIPLSSKIFLHSQSIKLEDVKDTVISISEGFPGEIERINYGLFDNSYAQVACEDYDYLLRFKNNLNTIREMCVTKAN